MAYSVHISDRERAYLESLPLSAEAKQNVEDFIVYAIARVDDAFRNDPANRPKSDAPYFQVEFFLLDALDGYRYHKLTFVVNDEHAAVSVLSLAFVDHQAL
ncbi:MAG TPA: hypothetical protein VN688_30210 [Gemmataceae bacterium]|nr:hypothetical protein [Gemmataceae bacterium]